MLAENGFIKSFDNTSLYYYNWPVQNPKAIIYIVHGMGEHAGRYKHVAEYFNRNDFSCFAFDLRGHGRSSGTQGLIPNYKALMEDINICINEVDKTTASTNRFLYGHSLGGNLVLNYTLRKQNDFTGVIATSPLLNLTFSPPKTFVVFVKILSVIMPNIVLKTGLKPEGLSSVQGVVSAYIDDDLVHSYISPKFFDEIFKAAEFAKTNASRFPRPLLLVHGTEDPITSFHESEHFAKTVPNCTFISWKGLLHETHNESCYLDVLACNLDWMKNMIKKE